jgi:hypothetical protein
MPNANAPMGLTPRRYRNGAPWTGAARTYHVPASNTTALFVGDPVIITGTGDSQGYSDVGIATAGGRVTGVVVGFRPTAPFSPNKFLAANTEGYVIVADDPTLLFEVQDNGNVPVTAIGLNANLIAGAGNQRVGWSGWQLDSTSPATTATLQVRIIELQHRADVEPGTNQNWLVALNQTTETPAAGSTGV